MCFARCKLSRILPAFVLIGCYQDKPPTASEHGALRPAFSGGSGSNGEIHYAKPNGFEYGNGASKDSAWSLQHAFDSAHPGDTVWLMGGWYNGAFTVSANGDSGNHIVFRQIPDTDVAAILRHDGGLLVSTTSLKVLETAEWTEFWDFEVANINTDSRTRTSESQSLPNAVWNQADHTKFMNLIIHDGGVAFLNDRDGQNPPEHVLISGCIIYNFGYDDDTSFTPARGHGHGLYLKNSSSAYPLVVADNIIFNGFGYGVHIFTNSGAGYLNNIHVKHNILFNNGTLSMWGTEANLGNLGEVAGSNLLFERNLLYFPPDSVLNLDQTDSISAGRNLVYTNPGKPDPTGTNVRNRNYVVGGDSLTVGGETTHNWDFTLEDSTASVPWSGNTIIMHQTADPHRGNIVVYHGSGSTNITVSPSWLSTNDSFEVRNAQDFGGPLEAYGRYNGSIQLSLTGDNPPNPKGITRRAPVNTAPAFNVFVVTRIPGAPSLRAPGLANDGCEPTPRIGRLIVTQHEDGTDLYLYRSSAVSGPWSLEVGYVDQPAGEFTQYVDVFPTAYFRAKSTDPSGPTDSPWSGVAEVGPC